MKTKILWDAVTEVLTGKSKTRLEKKKDLKSITKASTLRNWKEEQTKYKEGRIMEAINIEVEIYKI